MGLRKKKTPPPADLPVLRGLNKGIETFIRDTITTSCDTVQWISRHERFEPAACWKLKGCKRTSCPSYGRSDVRCWLKSGTFSSTRAKCTFARQYATCHECDVFTGLPGGQIRRLHENIGILISLLQVEADKLRRLAIQDPLTQVYNRNYFNQIIKRETLRSERSREPLSFIMIDLDDFKRINDKLGHVGGDGILKEVALLIKNTVRRSDLVFRIGGDEFLILMLNANCKKSTRMTKRLLAATEQWNRDKAEHSGCRISFSMGCATHAPGRDVDAVLRLADEQMYRNKKTAKKNPSCSCA